MYSVTIHAGAHAGNEDSADVLFLSTDEAGAWDYYSSTRVPQGTTIALWRPDQILIASKSGLRVVH